MPGAHHGGNSAPNASTRRYITVNGDDFGFSTGVNQAIIKAHEQGVLTSTSLMVTADAADQAVALAREHPGLAVGLHLVLICGRSALPPSEVPLLVDASGAFSNDPVSAGFKYYFNREARQQIRREIRAQLEKFGATGLKLTHVDGHLHMHSHPVIFNTLISLAKEFNIRTIRVPREELSPTLKVDRSALFTKVVWYSVFRCLYSYGSRKLKRARIDSPERVYGLLESGKMSEEYILKLLPQIRARRVELYSHPAVRIEGEPLNGPPGSGQMELEALLSPRVRRAMEEAGFVLSNFNGAEAGAPS